MRKAIGWLLVVIGAFLLIAALLLRFYATPALKVTPLSLSITTYLDGTAEKLNPSTGEVEDLDVKVTSVTETDDEASDDDVVVWVNTTCVVVDEPGTPDCVDAGTEDNPDERLITVTTDVFATDRETAEALSAEEGDDYLPSDAEPHDGLVNKWPFDAEKKTYPYWDGMLGEAVPATYVGTENVEGIETYVYEVNEQERPAEVVKGVDGIYSIEKTIKVDPVTGSIVYQSNHDVRTLENGDPLLDLTVEFTDEQVEEFVADAEDGRSSVQLISVTAPIAGTVLGLLLLAGGLFLVFGRRKA
jgi:hypothetical protein